MRRLVSFVFALTFTGTAAAQWLPTTEPKVVPPRGNIYYAEGNVAIGHSLPVTSLDIIGSKVNSSAKFGPFEIQDYADDNTWMGHNVYYDDNRPSFVRRTANAGALLYFFNGSFAVRTFPSGAAGSNVGPAQMFIIQPDGTIGLGGLQDHGASTKAHMLIAPSGNVTLSGTGTGASPNCRLTVNGDVNVTGHVSASYEDVAEWVPAKEDLAAGTVVVLDPTVANTVMASSNAYDTSVAGVISAQPGLILGRSGRDKEQVATTGRVRVRVDASVHAIAIGDLLVTGDKPGTAMRSQPVVIGGRPFHQPGTILGKALEPLASGEGEILVLLSLQ